jgi:hypothetical protein
MKTSALVILVSFIFPLQSFAYTIYSCSNDSKKVSIDADDFVNGKAGKETIDYKGKPTFNKKEGVLIWKDSKKSFVLKIQPAGPYDGLQDALWGELTINSKKIPLTCFLTEVSRN